MSLPPDQVQRQAAIGERSRNVVVDAGAGTGKTTLLVSRLIEMLAPADDARAAIEIGRIAAVTFTRKAAGELRLRIRERLLSEAASATVSPERSHRLRGALGGLDIAHIGTVHAFADRLLRRHPVEAGLSPAYDIIEDEEDLLREMHETLVTSSEAGTLAARLAGRRSASRAGEAQATVLDYLRVPPRSDISNHRKNPGWVFNGVPNRFDSPLVRCLYERIRKVVRSELWPYVRKLGIAGNRNARAKQLN